MKKNRTTHFMSGILILVFAAIFLIVTGRFLYIQTTGEINGVSLDDWAEKKRTASYNLPANRGKIMDDNGVTLAYDRPTFRLYAIVDEAFTSDENKPMHVIDPEKTAKELASVLDVKMSTIQKRLEDGLDNDQFQVEFGTNGSELTQKEKDKIEELELPGIKFEEESKRYYPNGTFASQILGFADKGDNGISGVTGIEKQMNKVLEGKKGHISYQRDKYNTKLLNPEEVIDEPKNGDNVHLTIDQKVQTLLEDVMSQAEEKYNPERMTAIVMNPKTGEIQAMSNRPSYNPNSPSDVENWFNDAISTPFEPGSTMKMFTWAAAIEEGVYNGDDTFESGKYKVSDRDKEIRDWKQSWGTLTYDEGFERSSNVAAAKLAWEKIKPENYLDYLESFGFDEDTGIDLPEEESGHILYNYPIEKVTSAFGQGTTATPIQQMKAASAIANDGKMVKPYVMSKTTDASTGDVIEETKPEVAGEPISKETAGKVKDLMETVVTGKHGTGEGYNLDDYSVVGKTGTSQIPDQGGYLTGEENHIFSFLGMAPKDDPELMMYVSIKQPELDEESREAGSVPVSFVFNNVMKSSLRYLNIDPDKDTDASPDAVTVPEIDGQNADKIKKQLSDDGLSASIIGDGEKIEKANVKKDDTLPPNAQVFLITDNPEMPDITDWSLRDVLEFADLVDLKLETNGNGYVVNQSIKEGKALKEKDKLEIDLKAPDEKDDSG